jgi:hypothetical protein
MKTALPLSPDLPQRTIDLFWSKVTRLGDSDCWTWLARKSYNGYGLFFTYANGNRVALRAHRLAYALQHGHVPAGLVIDHLCENRACCNPSHLQAISHTENVRKGRAPSALNGKKTHCKRGHPLEDARGYGAAGAKGWRVCRECLRRRNKTSTGRRGRPPSKSLETCATDRC